MFSRGLQSGLESCVGFFGGCWIQRKCCVVESDRRGRTLPWQEPRMLRDKIGQHPLAVLIYASKASLTDYVGGWGSPVVLLMNCSLLM